MRTKQIIIKGNKGFTFEFKETSNGIAFIRYQEGDRDGSPVNHISNLLTNFQAEQLLRSYAGCNEKIIKAIKELLQYTWQGGN